MIDAPKSMVGSYSYHLVTLSVLISILASYAALELAARITAATGRVRLVWLVGGAIAMGVGIWSMHYIGMLAFSLPVPVLYDWPTVLLSLIAAILASAVALFVVSPGFTGQRDHGQWNRDHALYRNGSDAATCDVLVRPMAFHLVDCARDRDLVSRAMAYVSTSRRG